VKIEAATETDALAAIHAVAFASPWSGSDIAALLASPGVFALAGRDVRGPHGFILVRAIAGEAEILTLAVDPAFRRRGLARVLVEAATGVALGLEAEALFLEVAEDNAAAIALYTGLSFAEVGRRRGYYARPNGAGTGGAHIDALVMRRDLNRRPA
jgi:ribosomal-protein-alanine N-acetyltransferase